MPSIDIVDFSGGITENYVAGAINKYQAADNLLIDPAGNPKQLFIRPGSVIYQATDDQLPSGIQRVGSLYYFRSAAKLIAQSRRDLQYFTTSWQELVGPTSNKPFPAAIDVTNYTSYAYWNNHLFYTSDGYMIPGKIYRDGSGNLQLRTAGLPALASNPTITPGANTGKSFLYRFVYYYTYAVDTVTFEDFGAVTEIAVTSADAPNTNANAITTIPALANGILTNWDTANIKVKIFRTTNAGTVFYYVGQVTNGTTTYSDTMSDTTLQLSTLLYTEGGVVENDAPPSCKFVHVTEDNVGIYANVLSGSQQLSNRVQYSVPGDPDSCPGDFFEDVDDEITGISSIRSSLIVFCKSSIYRLEGFFDNLGRGSVQKTKLSEVTGCVGNQSIVQTTDGIFWAGNDGFYFTDGFKVMNITMELTSTYKTFIDTEKKKKQIIGKYDRLNRRIWWAVQIDSASLDNDTCYIADLNMGISPNMAFTTASGGDYFRPCAIEFENNDLIRADTRGYLFRHNDAYFTDPRIDTSTDAANWFQRTIVYDYRSCALNFGTNTVRKIATRIVSVFKNLSNLSVQINAINDDGRKTLSLKPIRFRSNLTWGDAEVLWGDPDVIWDFSGLIIEQRRMPARSLRCSYKQIEITNAYTNVITSDVLGAATGDNSAKTLTLNNAAIYDWPEQSVDYYLSFSTDSFDKQYLVTNRSANVLTYSDVLNTSPSGAALEWELKGYPKAERFKLIGYTLDYELFGQTQPVYNTGEDGGVAS